MKIAWEVLEDEWEDDQDVIIGNVDCDLESDMCEEYGVVGTPTLLYGDRNDLNEYAGDMSFSKLNIWAKKVLVPTCSPDNLDSCNDIDKERIESWVKLSIEEIGQLIQKVDDQEKDIQIEFDIGMKKLQVSYDDLNEVHVLEKARMKREVKFLRDIYNSRRDR